MLPFVLLNNGTKIKNARMHRFLKNKEYSSKDYTENFYLMELCGLIWNKMFDKKTLEGSPI